MSQIIRIALFCAFVLSAFISAGGTVLNSDSLSKYVEQFNSGDNELFKEAVPNSDAEKFLSDNIPLFDCPDKEIEEVYYFRWWTFRKHIKKTPEGWAVTEFSPNVRWGGLYNLISCASGFHAREGRWLKDSSIISEYLKVMLTSPHTRPRGYTFAAARAVYDLNVARSVSANTDYVRQMYPILKKNSQEWEKMRRPDPDELFWQTDLLEGSECSISGAQSSPESMEGFKKFEMFTNARGYRANMNSYMYADYQSLSKMASALGYDGDARTYADKASKLKDLINGRLWSDSHKFYMTRSAFGNKEMCDVRELNGYTPWLFGIAPERASVAWNQLVDEGGFKAPYGPTTAERRHPMFRITRKGHECQWAGVSWPYMTGSTLISLANLLNESDNPPLGKSDYFDLLKTYARTHSMTWGNGKTVRWIDECADPFTGEWITRSQLMNWNEKGWCSNTDSGRCPAPERGKDYNHSVFCDLVITGLVGVRPLEGNNVEISPLVPDDWDFFCLDNLNIKGRVLTVMYDKTGKRYGRGKGFVVFVDGVQVKTLERPGKMSLSL